MSELIEAKKFLPVELAPEYLRLRINDKSSFENLLEFPSYVYLEVTADCNASCRMCTFAHNENRFMSDELFEKATEEILENKKYIKYVVLQGRGEPLLDPKIAERVAVFSKQNDIPTFMSTNCELLSEEKAVKLLDAKISTIVLSIDSLNKEIYEKIRHGMDFDTVLKNIHRFIKLRDKINPASQVRIRMIEQKPNIGEWCEFEKYWKQFLGTNDRLTIKKLHAWGGKLNVSDLKYAITDQDLFPCIGLWSAFILFYNGHVPLCCADESNILGSSHSVYELNNIRDIWKSNIFNHFRNLHLNGQKEPSKMCNGCSMFAEPSDYEHIGKKLFPEAYTNIRG